MRTTELQQPGAILPLTDATFAAEIEGRPGVALVDFGADWCAPCRLMVPVIERIAADYAGRVTVAAIDVDASERVTTRFGVRSFPTFLFFRDGVLVDRIVGAVPRPRLTERLDALLARR